MSNTVGPASMVGAMLLGIALLWSVRLAYGSRRMVVDDTLRLVLTIAGWLLFHVGLFSLAAQAFYTAPTSGRGLLTWVVGLFFFSFIVLGTMLIVFGMAVARFRALEWNSLMWMLAAAAEKGIPLHEAAHAFALERGDEIGLRTERLAQLLEQGVPFPDALERSGTHLSTEGLLAARYGTELGDLNLSISHLTPRDDDLDVTVRTAVEKCFYLGLLVGIMLLQMLFVWLRILPIFSMMFRNFGYSVPASTDRLVAIGSSLAPYAWVLIPTLLLYLTGLTVGLLYYLGWLPRDTPGLALLTRRYDTALLLRSLAVAVGQQQPLHRTVWVLARMYPRRRVRRRLERAGRYINDGMDWCTSLRREGLLTEAESGLLRAAERVGNLAWACQEMADSALRRLAYRLRFALSILFPLALLGIGGVLAMFVIGMFLPLVHLVHQLP